MTQPAMTREEFLARLKAEGEKRYHDQHPFHVRMHAGELSRAQIQGWVINRYYYQTRIPIKDAIILSKSEDPEFRRGEIEIQWLERRLASLVDAKAPAAGARVAAIAAALLADAERSGRGTAGARPAPLPNGGAVPADHTARDGRSRWLDVARREALG